MNTFINIIGFSIGIAACLFIFLFVKHETNFDNFYPNKNQLFRIIGKFQSNDNVSETAFNWMPVAPEIKSDIPGVDAYCRVTSEMPAKFFSENQVFQINEFRFADENFFSFFNFKLRTGNPKTVLNSADQLVLTEETAYRIFGTTNVVGKTMLYQHQVFTISGVAENLPTNTHLGFGALISTHYVEQSDAFWKNWGGGIRFLSYLQLAKGVSPEQIERALPDFLEQKINAKWKESGWFFSAFLQKIQDVHISDGTIESDCASTRSKTSIYIVGCISFLILLLAIINYIVLYTAQKIAKTKDIGILKIHGAEKHVLVFQIYIEVLIIAFISSVFAILLLRISLPFLNVYLKTSVFFGTEIVAILCFLVVAIFVLSALVTFFSTRRVVSSKSIDVLKNQSVSGASKNMEIRFLISFQFSVVILLFISLFIISRQNNFLLNKELGFDKESIITLEADEEFLNNELAGFKQDLQSLIAVRSVSLSSQTVGRGLTMNGYRIEGEQTSTMIKVLYTDADFLQCFGVHLLEGRNFSQNNKQDQAAILINQKLVDRSGWNQPLGKTINRNGDLEVIGVVDDFNFETLQNQVQPMLIMSNPNWDGWGYSMVNIRFHTSDIQGLIKQINHLWKERFPETTFNVSFLDDVLAANYESLKAQQKIISFFSLLATLIACIGLFGLTVFTTRRRIKEIGVRKVNGAKISEVMTMLNKDFVKWVAIAFVMATPVAYFAMHKWLENFAYKTSLSWWIFALAGLLALGIALLTVSWQSWKAATRNPVEALRYE